MKVERQEEEGREIWVKATFCNISLPKGKEKNEEKYGLRQLFDRRILLFTLIQVIMDWLLVKS